MAAEFPKLGDIVTVHHREDEAYEVWGFVGAAGIHCIQFQDDEPEEIELFNIADIDQIISPSDHRFTAFGAGI